MIAFIILIFSPFIFEAGLRAEVLLPSVKLEVHIPAEKIFDGIRDDYSAFKFPEAIRGTKKLIRQKKNEDVFYKLSNGASGYQTSIPIVLGIKFYTEIDKRKRTFIVEEPEINLFPSTQKKLMAYFIKNVNNNKHSFIIPTHSPYFLSAINDYLIAYKKGKLNESETSKIINKDYWLNIDDISCYQLKNGEAYNIIDKKSGLISDNIIDDVSDEMNDEFENLLDIR